MGVVTSKREVVTKGSLGEPVTLKWKIQNASKKEWPAKPFLRNYSDDLVVPD